MHCYSIQRRSRNYGRVFYQINQAVKDVALTDQEDALAKQLSGGQKRKLCVAMALICDPKVRYLPPATKLGQGNIFRSVCQEFCSHPAAVHAGRYGQQAGGTHPTEMHTCQIICWKLNMVYLI